MPNSPDDKVAAVNRKARHDYEILETMECGLVLTGTEIKSIRAGRANLKDGYAKFKDGELWLENVHISPYEKATAWVKVEPHRARKLLLHRRELRRLQAKVNERGFTLVPLKLYVKGGKLAKIELGLARGKSAADRRDDIRERDVQRSIARELRNRN